MGKVNVKFNTLVVLLAGALSMIGCSHKATSSNAPAPQIGQSFQVMKTTAAKTDATPDSSASAIFSRGDNYTVAIARSALNKEFLLQSELIQQVPAAEGNSLKSRIVTFVARDKNVYMLESTAGNTVTTDIPQHLLLATFPVVNSDDNKIVFDFNDGMQQVYVAGDMNGSDSNGSEYDPNTEFQVQQLSNSYITSAQVEDTATVHRLVIEQVAQLQQDDSKNNLAPVEVRYYLSPYLPDSTYQKSQQFDNFTNYGYFQVAPQITTEGDSVQYAMRWDPRQPITYAISSNTPPQFVQAEKDGVLYWNKVFGRTMMKVVMAPAGVTAPNPDYNLIQWVPYDTAGYAYADMQADPRTGQILHAQIYIPSAFVYGAEIGVRTRLRALAGESTNSGDAAKFLANVNARAEKAAADEVRATVAHEVGHTLGLRHNFAGSLAANYTMAARAGYEKSYLSATPNDWQPPQNLVVTSSIMDYLRFTDDLIVSEQIVHGTALSHDQGAIRLLYDGVQPSGKWPLFCTDSNTDTDYDCQQFDAGSSEVAYGEWYNQHEIGLLPNTLIESYISAKTPFSNQVATPIAEVALPNPKTLAHELLTSRYELLKQFTKAANIVGVQRNFGTVGEFNSDAVRAQQAQYLATEIKNDGGYGAAFVFIQSNYAGAAMKQLDTLIRGVYRSGYGDGGVPYTFSDADIQTIEANAALFFKKFQQEYDDQTLALLAGQGMGNLKFLDNPLSTQLGDYLANVAATIMLSTSKTEVLTHTSELPFGLSNLTGKKTTTTQITLPIFNATLKERGMAASMLSASRCENPMWMFNERLMLEAGFKQMIAKVLGDPSKLNASTLPPDAVEWLSENMLIYSTLANSGPSAPGDDSDHAAKVKVQMTQPQLNLPQLQPSK